MSEHASAPTFDSFKAAALADGFDEAIERQWGPNTVLETHTHPFTARAVVKQGALWLTYGNETRHLQVGDTFELSAGTPHDERYGEHGATYWVARRNEVVS
jgi:AraC-like ligand binding domain